MDFFKPEDFLDSKDSWSPERMAMFANAKLEREGRVVYFVSKTEKCWNQWLETVPKGVGSKTALLIDIKPINKPTYEELEKELFVLKTQIEMDKAEKQIIININCLHPKEKVKEYRSSAFNGPIYIYRCECGAKVAPLIYEQVK